MTEHKMYVLGVDPAPKESAVVAVDPISLEIKAKFFCNTRLLVERHDWGFGLSTTMTTLHPRPTDGVLAIERPVPMGQRVGHDVFDTLIWTGRLYQAFSGERHMIRRTDIKISLCGKINVRDSDIRAALIKIYTKQNVLPLGGGATPAIGIKKHPGPLYGIKADLWQALAAAISFITQPSLE